MDKKKLIPICAVCNPNYFEIKESLFSNSNVMWHFKRIRDQSVLYSYESSTVNNNYSNDCEKCI